jgi:uncharacterized membrane protein YqaE (UPF0057 family)
LTKENQRDEVQVARIRIPAYAGSIPGNRPGETTRMDILRLLFSLLLPPLGVFLQVGIGLQFWLNIVLTICGYIPGVVHAAYIIGTR